MQFEQPCALCTWQVNHEWLIAMRRVREGSDVQTILSLTTSEALEHNRGVHLIFQEAQHSQLHVEPFLRWRRTDVRFVQPVDLMPYWLHKHRRRLSRP